jgi:hypothetical protein
VTAEAILEAVCRTLEASGRAPHTVWVYGGWALDPERADDVDLLVVTEGSPPPCRFAVHGSGRTRLSINAVSAAAVAGAEAVDNGFFFAGKLLAPHRLLFGTPAGSDRLLARAHAEMLRWAVLLVDDDPRTLTVPQSTALLFLLRIATDYAFAIYVAGWWAHPCFEALWQARCATTAAALDLEDPALSDDVPSRQLRLQRICAAFWDFNARLRGDDPRFVEKYFRAREERLASISPAAVNAAIDFLLDTVGRPVHYGFPRAM